MGESQSSKERGIPGPGARQLAELFHDRYEKLAPEFGWMTRMETRTFDPNSTNGRLMIAVCDEILTSFDRQDAADLQVELETERMRLAGCGVAALADTPKTVAERLTRESPYWSASYGDVCRMVDRLMELRAALLAWYEASDDEERRWAMELTAPLMRGTHETNYGRGADTREGSVRQARDTPCDASTSIPDDVVETVRATCANAKDDPTEIWLTMRLICEELQARRAAENGTV